MRQIHGPAAAGGDVRQVHGPAARRAARRPSDREWEIFGKYRKSVASRGEAFEDLLWSLVNSTEFLSER